MNDDLRTRIEDADPVHRLRHLLDARTTARQNLEVLDACMQNHTDRVPPALQEAYEKTRSEFNLAEAKLKDFLAKYRSR